MTDRGVILSRVRAAVVDVPTDESSAWLYSEDPDPAAAYNRAGIHNAAERLRLFVSRCEDYRAAVTVCEQGHGAIAIAVAAACDKHKARMLAVPATLEAGWCPPGVDIAVDDPPLSLHELDACDGVLTGCELAIAMTGTVVLAAGSGQGRRAVSLVPDLHICVVKAEQIVETVPEALERLVLPVAAGRPVTFVSGPSATSDIELRRVEGVHGPRTLEVIVVPAGA